MHLSVCTCVYVCLYFFVTACFAWAPGADTHPKKEPSFNDHAIQRGLTAEQHLMDGAEMAFYESEQMLLYRKPGNLNDAVADFRYLKPQNVQYRKGTESALMKGIVGDRDLALYMGQNLYPQITLTKFDSNYRSYTKAFWYIGSSGRPFKH